MEIDVTKVRWVASCGCILTEDKFMREDMGVATHRIIAANLGTVGLNVFEHIAKLHNDSLAKT